jgi:hypothetical protein
VESALAALARSADGVTRELPLAKLCRRTGKRQEGQEHLTTATTMFRDMDMRFWLEQAEVELKGLAERNPPD